MVFRLRFFKNLKIYNIINRLFLATFMILEQKEKIKDKKLIFSQDIITYLDLKKMNFIINNKYK